MTDELNQQVPPQDGAQPAQPADYTNDPEFQVFQQQLQRYLGFGVSDLVGSVQTVRQLAAEREASLLRQQWGNEYDANFQAVQTRLVELHKTNPALAESLNNAQGAQLIHAQLQVEAMKAAQPASVPGFQRTSTPATPQARNTPLFKQSEIAAMSRDERRARHAEVAAAYAAGLVSPD